MWYGRDPVDKLMDDERRASRTINKLLFWKALLLCACARPMLTIIINNRWIKHNTPHILSHTCGAEHYWWCLFFKRFSSFSEGGLHLIYSLRTPRTEEILIIRKTCSAQRWSFINTICASDASYKTRYVVLIPKSNVVFRRYKQPVTI